LDRVRDSIRLEGYSVRTEEAYVGWIKRFILFHDKRHPREMGYSDIKAFLLHLAVEETVAASTQNQALNGLLFLYREVLGKDWDGPIKAIRVKSAKRLPTVLTLPRAPPRLPRVLAVEYSRWYSQWRAELMECRNSTPASALAWSTPFTPAAATWASNPTFTLRLCPWSFGPGTKGPWSLGPRTKGSGQAW